VKMFDAGKTRMIGLPYGQKNYDNMLSRFRLIPERNGQTDGQTDGQIWGGALKMPEWKMQERQSMKSHQKKIL